jgi:cytidylate kinase-like protein
MSLVALSASYGAGGSRIGPALAARLEVPFLDRAIPAAVAEELAVPLEDANAHDEQTSAGWLERMLSGFIGLDSGSPVQLPPELLSSADFRRTTEEILLRQAASGQGVILGRGGVIVLREDPRVLRVRLDGPFEQRVRRAAVLEGIEEARAERRVHQLDRTHAAYFRQLYGLDICSPTLYHVVLDSTAIDVDACVEMLATAAASIRSEPALR